VRDFLQDCMEDFRRKAKLGTTVSVADFKDLFCSKCNQECVHRGAGDPLVTRVRTQAERLTNPTQANPNLPQYAEIIGKEWADKTMEALRLEIADRRNDWEIPILDGTPLAATPSNTEVVDDAVRQLAKAKGQKAPEFPASRDPAVWDRAVGLAGAKAKNEKYVQVIYDRLVQGQPEPEPEPEPEAPKEPPAPQHPKKHPKFRPQGRGNAPDQGGMIGGGPPPAPKEEPDPWAAPTPVAAGNRTVSSGATIKLSGGKIVDE
jgi:hypothetical protein